MFEVSPSIQIPPEEFQLTFARSGGPGGQNVNKVNSKAVLRWRVAETPSLPFHVRRRFLETFASRITLDGDLILTSQQYRDQASNIDYCMEKLKAMILEVLYPPTPRRPTKPTKASKIRRVNTKRVVSIKKQQRRSPGADD